MTDQADEALARQPRISVDAPLAERIDAAMRMVRPLVDQDEDYIWRPASAAMDVLSACKKELAALTAARQAAERVATLFDAIAHGDDVHRAWLKQAIDAHFAGRPVDRARQAAVGEGVRKSLAELKAHLEQVASNQRENAIGVEKFKRDNPWHNLTASGDLQTSIANHERWAEAVGQALAPPHPLRWKSRRRSAIIAGSSRVIAGNASGAARFGPRTTTGILPPPPP